MYWPGEALWGSSLSEDEAVVTTEEIQAIARKLTNGPIGILNIPFMKAVEEFSEIFKVVFQGLIDSGEFQAC